MAEEVLSLLTVVKHHLPVHLLPVPQFDALLHVRKGTGALYWNCMLKKARTNKNLSTNKTLLVTRNYKTAVDGVKIQLTTV